MDTLRYDRVRRYMESLGFRVSAGTCGADSNLATVDIDRLDAQEINGAWAAYERGNAREKVWAIIAAARDALSKFAVKPEKPAPQN